MRRRSFFTLIEMMVSLTLLALLLSTLFLWYRHLTLGKGERVKQEWKYKEESYLDLQLSKILPKANLKPCFFTTMSDQNVVNGNSLVFTFDNGAQEEKELSGTVLGRLFLDCKSKTLCLGIWPAPETREKTPCRTRVLLNDVRSVSFNFYYPPDPRKLGVDPEKIGTSYPREGWQPEWSPEFHLLPPMMQLIVHRENDLKALELCYDLPLSSVSRIVYKEGS